MSNPLYLPTVSRHGSTGTYLLNSIFTSSFQILGKFFLFTYFNNTCLKMSAAEQMRMMLDQLMGADRNGKFLLFFKDNSQNNFIIIFK